MTVRIIDGDCRLALKTLPSQSVQCVVTSPPYFGLRDYQCAGQIGREPTPTEYVAELVAVFREVWRVLRDDGTLWLNLGDSYASAPLMRLKPKDLMMIPARVAIALQEDGWYLRSSIIWHKPNPMPESVTDRPTKSHEDIFLLTKKPNYFYDAEAIKEPGTIPAGTKGAKGSAKRFAMPGVNSRPPEYKIYDGTRNARSVWTIATAPFAEAHFATFPTELAERCIKAGTSERGACPTCGAPWKRKTQKPTDDRATATIGWTTTCRCPPAKPVPCVCMDLFGGAGTVGLVADRLQRNSIIIELNLDYAEIARHRILKDAALFSKVST